MMKPHRSKTENRHHRRHFLQLGAGTVVGLSAGPYCLGESLQPAQSPRPSGKSTFQLGLASYTLRKFPLDRALAMTRRVGLKFICLKSFHLPLESSVPEIEAAAAKCRAAGVEPYGCGVVTMSTESDVRQTFAYAKAAGMKTIVASPAPDRLPLVNQMVQESGIAVAIHNHGPGDKIYPTPQAVYERVRDLDPRIGLCIDIGHTVRIGADPIESAEKYADRLLDVHVKDVSSATAKGETLEIGRGVIDIPRFLNTLCKIQYRGIVSFEHEKDENDPLAGLAESVGYVRGVLAAI